MIRILSWGCGVQSTTLGEMSARGDLPRLDAILTSDTGWERQATYDIRDWYMARWRKMGMRVEVIAGGDVRREGAVEHVHIPFWTSDGGPLQRQCTRHFKITPIKRRSRELAGYHATLPPHPPPGIIETWLGISLDEYTRMKHSHVKFITHRYPLVGLRIDRQDCIEWLKERGLPVPVKSACIGCPYRRASEWLEMRKQAPEEFAAAVAFDEENRHNPLAERGGSTADELYVWKDGPLVSADLELAAKHERVTYGFQAPMFVCESGYCWT